MSNKSPKHTPIVAKQCRVCQNVILDTLVRQRDHGLVDVLAKVRRLVVPVDAYLVLHQQGDRNAGHRRLQGSNEDERFKGEKVLRFHELPHDWTALTWVVSQRLVHNPVG